MSHGDSLRVCARAHQSRMEKQIVFFFFYWSPSCPVRSSRRLSEHSCVIHAPLSKHTGVCVCVCWHVSKCMFSCVNCSLGRDNEFCHVSVWMSVCVFVVSETLWIRSVMSSVWCDYTGSYRQMLHCCTTTYYKLLWHLFTSQKRHVKQTFLLIIY